MFALFISFFIPCFISSTLAAGTPSAATLSLPLAFERNGGQAGEDVRYLSRARGYTLLLKDRAAVFTGRGRDLRLTIAGAGAPAVAGRGELPGHSNYYVGNDPSQWRTDVPQYGKVEYRNVYPGVDLVYYGREGTLEYDFILAPGADPSMIRLNIDGAGSLKIDDRGDLVLTSAGAEMRFHKPEIYQEKDGRREAVGGGFRRIGKRGVGFNVGEYDRSRRLVIDPTITAAVYLGGSDADYTAGIALDSSKNIYIAAYTKSANFPLATGTTRTPAGDYDVVVLKLSPDAKTILYSTVLAGSALDTAGGISVGPDGSASVVGRTSSANFPLLNAAQPTRGSDPDAFVARLSPTGTLMYSTFLGGSGFENAAGVAAFADGSTLAMGSTNSANFPTKNSSRTTGWIFLTKYGPTGTITFSTLVGGSGSGNLWAMATDAQGNAYISGDTASAGMATTGAYQTTVKGLGDVFVMKVSADGASVVFCTYIGGSANEYGRGIAVDSGGNVYVTGETASTNFPVLNPYQATPKGGDEGYLAVINSTGTALLASTYIGGSAGDTPTAVKVLSQSANTARVVIAGNTASTDFPLLNPLQSTLGGGLCKAGSTCIGGFYAVFDVTGLPAAPSQSSESDTPAVTNTPSLAVFSLNSASFFGGAGVTTPTGIAFIDSFINDAILYIAANIFGAVAVISDPAPGGNDIFLQIIDLLGTGADLSVTSKTNLETLVPGRNYRSLDLLLTVKNGGPENAKNVKLVIALPAAGIFSSPFINTDMGDGFVPCTISSAVVTCTTSSLDVAKEFTIAVTGRLAGAGSVSSRADVSSDTPDPNMANNNATAAITLGSANLNLTEGGPAQVGLTTDAIYVALVENLGPQTANSVMYIDGAPLALSSTLTPSQGTCSPGSSVCNLGSLASGASARITITRRLSQPPLSDLLVAAEAVSSDFDPDVTNNVVTFTVKYKGAPSISSMSPTSGTAGTEVTIIGNLFGSGVSIQSKSPQSALDAIVKFNGTVAAITSNTGTQLKAIVPTGATTGPITVTTAGGTATSATFTVTSGAAPANQPVIGDGGVVDAAAFGAKLVPGSLASVFGVKIATSQAAASALPLPTTLGGGTLQFNDPISVPTIFASPGQSNFQVPWDLLGETEAYLTSVVGGIPANPVKVSIVPAAPAIFTTTQTGKGQGAVQLANTTIFAAPVGSIPGVESRPAQKGVDFLTIYCTGLGDVNNRPASGAAAPGGPLADTKLTPSLMIGGVAATATFSGLTPGFVGLYQVNVQVPASVTPGSAVPLIITIGGVQSNTVTIAVQ